MRYFIPLLYLRLKICKHLLPQFSVLTKSFAGVTVGVTVGVSAFLAWLAGGFILLKPLFMGGEYYSICSFN
jgi:hypothetical protein